MSARCRGHGAARGSRHLPRPFLRGYVVAGEEDQDVTTFLSPSGAWASGAVVSTPADLNTFIRAYLGLRFFGARQHRNKTAATASGRRAVTTTLNIPAPTGPLLRRLRRVQATAVCALLRRRACIDEG